jgi:hypothetical protein
LKKNALLANALLVCGSLVASLLLAELAARIVLNPSDYLSVEMIRDARLGAVPSPTTRATGFDDWGFRNPAVPDTADIVAIGDSHTFGNTATMEDSWPHVLGRLSGQRVYTLGMGGYGPNQYFHLFETRALTLKPRAIVVGLYMGDDFENAFLITYGLDHWSRLRALPADKVDFDIWAREPAPSWHKRVRIWLSRNSVVYQLVFHGPILGRLQGETQIRNAELVSPEATSISIPEKNILEAFRPKGVARNLDQGNEHIREGMRITFALLGEMNERSRAAGIRFIVAVIPTKETVFAEHLEARTELHLGPTIRELIANERTARDRTFAALRAAGIEYVDTLPALRAALQDELYARTASDMHPNRNGYRVIAEAIKAAGFKDKASR